MTKRWFLALAMMLAAVVSASADELAIGSTAPDFVLQDINGNTKRLSADKGNVKAFVIIWVSKNCPVSQAYEGRIQALYNDYRQQGVLLYTINSNASESVQGIKAHMAQRGLSFPVLRDGNQKVANDYHARVTPEVFVLDRNMVVRYHGAIDNNKDESRVDSRKRWARSAISAVAAGGTPNPSKTAAEGCAVDRG